MENKPQQTVMEALGIDKERAEILSTKIKKIYEKTDKISDCIHMARELAVDAKEDILVCYFIGYLVGMQNGVKKGEKNTANYILKCLAVNEALGKIHI